MDKAIEGGDAVRRMKRKPRAAEPTYAHVPYPDGSTSRKCFDPAQIYAMRVWGGQSVDVPRAERIERCLNALRGQNLPTDGIEFPV